MVYARERPIDRLPILWVPFRRFGFKRLAVGCEDKTNQIHFAHTSLPFWQIVSRYNVTTYNNTAILTCRFGRSTRLKLSGIILVFVVSRYNVTTYNKQLKKIHCITLLAYCLLISISVSLLDTMLFTILGYQLLF